MTSGRRKNAKGNFCAETLTLTLTQTQPNPKVQLHMSGNPEDTNHSGTNSKNQQTVNANLPKPIRPKCLWILTF